MPFEPAPVTTEDFVEFLTDKFGPEVNAPQVREAAAHFNVGYQTAIKRIRQYHVKRGQWNLSIAEKLERVYEGLPAVPAVEQNLIPEKDPNYVPFGNFSDVKKIVQSGMFYPTFITGLSGNGVQ